MIKKSDRVQKVHSDIRGPLYVEALRMQAEGTPVLKLNTGNPASFGFGLPNSVRKAVAEHLDEAVPYCDVKGMPAARKAILDYHLSRGVKNITLDDIFIGNGVSEMASMILTALIGTGDEILVPSPCYSLWSNNAYIAGSTPVHYRCAPENDWNPDLNDVRSKITPKTKALLIINPNNPTGAVYSRETLEELIQIARENNLVLLADEIYDRLIIDNLGCDSVAALAPDMPCVTFNGLSKSHIICGFRCGWMLFSGPGLEEIKGAVMQLASMRLCGNAVTQLAVPAAMEDVYSTREMMAPGGRLYEQSKAVVDVLSGVKGVSLVPNRAAFYLFPCIDKEQFDFESDQDFAMKFLHEKHVLVIPGRGFDWHEDLRFRIVMLPEADQLRKAMEDLVDFLEDHRK